MTLPFSYLIRGTVTDSLGATVDHGNAWAYSLDNEQGTNRVSIDADGKYLIDVRYYANPNDNVRVYAECDGEFAYEDCVADLKTPGRVVDITLDISNLKGELYLNTHKAYGNQVYTFDDWNADNEQNVKVCNYS